MTHSFDIEYWDQIWQGDRAQLMGSGEPNPHLVHEVGGLPPGTALDAGCGGGAEAIWLAGQGWQVTAADIAAAALDRAAQRAAASGVIGRVRWVQADLSSWQPGAQYDLVTTHYAHPSMPQLDFYHRLASWVAPGGTLLIVGHLDRGATDPRAGQDRGHGHGDTHGPGDAGRHHHSHSDEPPVSASATAASITARLDPTRWDIATAQESERIAVGQDGRHVTLHDVVFRATRR